MAKTYYYCLDDNVCRSREVSMTIQSVCQLDEYDSDLHGQTWEWWRETLRFSLDSAAQKPINVYYSTDARGDNDYSGSWGPETFVNYVTIPIGQLYKDVVILCYYHAYEDMGGGGWINDYYWEENPTLLEQPTVPDCCLSPTGVTCNITITGSTVTDCTVRGDSTGSIQVCISGASGNTTWYLEGAFVVSGITASCYTFTGLTAGAYVVLVEDIQECGVQDSYTVIDGEFRTGDFYVTAPTGLTAVENPIMIGVATAINNPNPLPDITTLTVAGTLADGFSLTFNITSPYAYSQTFYSKAYPNKPNYFLASILNNQYGVAVGNNSLTEIATSLADALANDALIPKVYYINNTGTVVTLQAKENGSRFNLDSSNVIASTTGVTVTQTQAGVDYCDGQITDNYSISCEVLVNLDYTNQYAVTGDTSDYNKVAEMVLPFSQDNIHNFDISGILKSQVSTPYPNPVFTGASIIMTAIQPYYVKLSEVYPLVANTNTVKKRYKTETPVRWVINSSLDRYSANTMVDYTTVPVMFLTNSPSPKQIQRNSMEFLYYVLPKNYGADFTCKGDMFFYDGTQVTGVTFFTISTGATNFGGVMMLNISYDKLGLLAYEVSGTTNRKIKRLELAVYASGGTIQYTEKKQYRFEIDEMPRKMNILFQNALGMYDSLDFIGVVEETINRDTGSYTVPINYGVNGSMPTGQKHYATYDTRVTNKLICNTGWIDETHFDWLKEMLKSNNIYNANSINIDYLNLTEWKYIKSSLDDLFDVEVTFEYTIYENNVSV